MHSPNKIPNLNKRWLNIIVLLAELIGMALKAGEIEKEYKSVEGTFPKNLKINVSNLGGKQ